MNRERFLVAHGVDPSAWATRHDIEPFAHPCDGCGKVLETSIPFACGSLRGLIAPTCECGHGRPPYCVVRERSAGDLFSGGEP